MDLLLLNIPLAQFPVNQLGMVIVGFLGASLVLALLGIVAWVVRARYLVRSAASSRVCPQCKSSLHRVHRTRGEKILCTMLNLPLGHYRCSNRHCHWQGLRRVTHEHHRQAPDQGVKELAGGIANPAYASGGASSKLDLNLHGFHIESGAAPLPVETPPLIERPPVPEIEESPVLQ